MSSADISSSSSFFDSGFLLCYISQSSMSEFISSQTFSYLVYSVLTILIVSLITLVIKKIVNRSIKDIKKQHTIRKLNIYISTVIAILVIALIWARAVTSVTTIIGFLEAGLTLALHQPSPPSRAGCSS